MEIVVEAIGQLVNTGSALMDTIVRVAVLFFLVERGKWIFLKEKARKNGNGGAPPQRRFTDKPGNDPELAPKNYGNPKRFSDINELCTRHDKSIKRIFATLEEYDKRLTDAHSQSTFTRAHAEVPCTRHDNSVKMILERLDSVDGRIEKEVEKAEEKLSRKIEDGCREARELRDKVIRLEGKLENE